MTITHKESQKNFLHRSSLRRLISTFHTLVLPPSQIPSEISQLPEFIPSSSHQSSSTLRIAGPNALTSCSLYPSTLIQVPRPHTGSQSHIFWNNCAQAVMSCPAPPLVPSIPGSQSCSFHHPYFQVRPHPETPSLLSPQIPNPSSPNPRPFTSFALVPFPLSRTHSPVQLSTCPSN